MIYLLENKKEVKLKKLKRIFQKILVIKIQLKMKIINLIDNSLKILIYILKI